MAIFAHYDHTGRIRGFVGVNGPPGTGMSLTPKPGHLVAEIDGLQLKSDAPHADELREIAKRHHVSQPAGRVTLTPRG